MIPSWRGYFNTKDALGLLVVGQPLFQVSVRPVRLAIYSAGDFEEVANVSKGRKGMLLPEPSRRATGVNRLLQKPRVIEQRQAQGSSAQSVISSSGALYEAPALESHAVPKLGIAEVFAALVGRTRCKLVKPLEFIGLHSNLSQKGRFPQRRLDAEFLHGVVQGLAKVLQRLGMRVLKYQRQVGECDHSAISTANAITRMAPATMDTICSRWEAVISPSRISAACA